MNRDDYILYCYLWSENFFAGFETCNKAIESGENWFHLEVTTVQNSQEGDANEEDFFSDEEEDNPDGSTRKFRSRSTQTAENVERNEKKIVAMTSCLGYLKDLKDMCCNGPPKRKGKKKTVARKEQFCPSTLASVRRAKLIRVTNFTQTDEKAGLVTVEQQTENESEDAAVQTGNFCTLT